MVEISMRLELPTTNKKVEYDAFIFDLTVASKRGA